jgi:hypothetical protein
VLGPVFLIPLGQKKKKKKKNLQAKSRLFFGTQKLTDFITSNHRTRNVKTLQAEGI